LLGQWVGDVRQALNMWGPEKDATGKPIPRDIIVIGEGPAGLVALAAAATDDRITKVAAVGTLASYITDVPYEGQRLGTLVPGILRDVGDVPHIAALAKAKKLVIAGGVTGNGQPLTATQLRTAYAAAKSATILDKPDPAAVVAELK